MRTKKLINSVILLVIISTSFTLVFDNEIFRPVSATGGSITIIEPSSTSNKIWFYEDINIEYNITTDSGYTYVLSKYLINGVQKGTSINEHVNVNITNIGVGYHTLRIEAVFTKNFFLYTEVEETNFYTKGRFYSADFSNITDWSVGTYDGSTGNPVNRENYFYLDCNGSVAYVYELDEGYENTYVFAEDTASLNWERNTDVKLTFQFRARNNIGTANFYFKIWGSSGGPLDYFYSRFENSATQGDWDYYYDSGWLLRADITLDKDDFDSSSGLTIAWGFKDPDDLSLIRTVYMDYIFFEYYPPS